MALTLKEITDMIMQVSKDKNWGMSPDEINVAEKIALAHSELSEALEAYRNHNMDGRHGFSEEMADLIIRALHLCGIYGIDIERDIVKKMEINGNRDWEHDRLHQEKKR